MVMAKSSKRDKHLDHYEQEIRNAMARTLWLMAYADYVERVDESGDEEDEPDEVILPRPGPGEDWDDYAPETPQAAHQAARDLAELFGKSENLGRRHPMVTLYELAMHADAGQPPDMSNLFGDLNDHHPQWARFAHGMVMEALGTGVSWSDDHKDPGFKVPSFECNFDGDQLIWSGRVRDSKWEDTSARASGDASIKKALRGPEKLRRNGTPVPECTTEYHELVKADPKKWAELELKTTSEFDADEEGPAWAQEYKDCPKCKSTLVKTIVRNPAGRFTEKGERMYQDIKAEYEAKRDPRAAEIAARTVYARSKTVPGLLNVGRGLPPGVPSPRRNHSGRH